MLLKKIVITGATGFIGCYLSKKLDEIEEFTTIKVTRYQDRDGFTSIINYKDTPSGDILIHLGEDPDRVRVNKIGEDYRQESGQVVDALLKKTTKELSTVHHQLLMVIMEQNLI